MLIINFKKNMQLKIFLCLAMFFVLSACSGGDSSTPIPIPIVDTTAPVITLNGDNPMTIVRGNSYSELGASAIDERDGTVDVVISGSVDTSTVGSYSISYSASDLVGNASTVTRAINVVLPVDTTPPVITLNGDNPMTIVRGNSYSEPGATAVDDQDGTVDVSVSGSVDTSTVGSYSISYSASDLAGNASTVTRTINVVLPVDTTPPVITLNGDNPMTIVRGNSYSEPGATAVDDQDGTVDVSISGSVDTSTVGSYSISYSASDLSGNTNTASRTINVVHQPFITRWNTIISGSTDDDQMKIGTSGSGYNYQVDWGDGSSDSNVTGDITHTYSTSGIYTVSISGAFPQIYFGDTGYDNSKLLSIEQWGDIQWQSMHQAFFRCDNLVGNATDVPDLSQVTDTSGMFTQATAFNQDIGNWDVSTVTNMSDMFNSAQGFNQDIANWDVSAVTNMNQMFYFALSFNQDIGNWDVSAVTDMSGMFTQAQDFNQNIGNWDVSAVTDMSFMFEAARDFNQSIGSWDVSAATNMSGMFYSAQDFNQDIANWDVSTVIDMSTMFRNAKAFNQDIGNWDVSAVTNMDEMFFVADAFNKDIGNWDVSVVSIMSNMFNSAAEFNQDIGNWDVSNVTNMGSMFEDASNFNQDIGNWDVSAVISMFGMLRGASFFNQDIGNWDVSNVTNMSNMFSFANTFNQDIGNWDVSAVVTMSNMFSFANTFNQDIGNWDVSNVIGMNTMFQNANVFNQDIGRWDVSSVNSMNSMFSNTNAFNQDIDNWDVSAVIDMRWMFQNASAFTLQDLSGWDVVNVLIHSNFFRGAGPDNIEPVWVH